MRQVRDLQAEFGEASIEDIKLNPKSRDDIPAILPGLQHIYADEDIRGQRSRFWSSTFVPAPTGRLGVWAWRCGGFF